VLPEIVVSGMIPIARMMFAKQNSTISWSGTDRWPTGLRPCGAGDETGQARGSR
jgi:hypothetical protein